LAAWLRDPAQEELVRDKPVLELGCGCGLPGIAF
jgi:predicted nicotinamide N-methyase